MRYLTFFPAKLKMRSFLACSLFALQAWGQEVVITVDATSVVNRIPDNLYGSCIEDVNHEIYGGLYDQRLFGESFEEPLPAMSFKNWKTLGGNWRLSGEIVSVRSGEGHKMVRNTPLFENGTVEADVMVKNGFNAGLLVRVSEEKTGADRFNGYEISLNPSAQSVILGRHLNNWSPLAEGKAAFSAGQWVHLKIVLSGRRLTVFIDRQTTPAIDFTDAGAPLSSGKIALRTYNADAEFKNVRITEGGAVVNNIFEGLDFPRISAAWDAVTTGTGGRFWLDTAKAYNGRQSQVLQRSKGTGKTGIANMGLNRWGIALRKGQKFEGRVYLSSEGLNGPVTVALQSADGKKIYASQKIMGINAQWKKYPFTLISSATDPKARFVLYIENAGKLWVDQAVLMSAGADQFKGLPLRADIARKMQEEGLNFLRYGGTMVNAPEYRWKKMIGDRDKRPPYRGHWYPYSTNAFGIEDFLQYCEAAGFEAAFAINIEETAQDAADMVEYLKGDLSTYWGKIRAQNGHPEPYKVKYIEIGNEEILFDGDVTEQYDHYIERFNALYEAMHAKDTSIKFINSAWWRPDSPNSARVFKALNGKAAYWDLHTDADNARAGTTVDQNLSRMRELFLKWDPNTTMKCAIFEENGGLHNMQRALGHATTLNAVRRHGDFVLTSCAANALQPLGQNDNGWDQGQIFFTPSQVWGMPPFYAQKMAAASHLPLRVGSETTGDLDVTATRSENGDILTLHVVNPSAGDIQGTTNIAGFSGGRKTAEVYTLAGELKAVNTPQAPEQVRTSKTTASIDPASASWHFPAHSYTIITIKK